MMNTRLLALLLACLFSAPVAAQKEPSEVTDKEIAKYKALADTSCREAGAKQGDPKEKIDAFCGCLLTTLNKSLTRPEWQQAYFYSIKGQTKEEMAVLGPHLKNVAACRPAPEAQPEAQATPPASQPGASPSPSSSQPRLRPPAQLRPPSGLQ
jgi:hypothetical protein